MCYCAMRCALIVSRAVRGARATAATEAHCGALDILLKIILNFVKVPLVQAVYLVEVSFESQHFHGGNCMKKTIFAVVLLTALLAIPVMAQEATGPNFSSKKPQYLAFNLGVPMGLSFADPDVSSKFVSGYNFGIDFAILDNLSVGYDRLEMRGNAAISPLTTNLFRAAFTFLTTDLASVGAALGFGQGTFTGTGATVNGLAMSLGIYGNFFENRSAYGLTYSLGLRVDYVVPAGEFGQGVLAFTLRTTLGM